MLRWLLILPLLILLVLFALSNMDEVQIRLWPFDLAWVSPLGVAVLILSAFAFLLGALVAWTASLQYRRRARRLEEAGRVLEAELVDIRARDGRQGPAAAAPARPAPPPSTAPRLPRPA